MQFAYRIGHFYHEGQNGRRRGVIRDVPPEQTPVTVIAGQMRHDSVDLFIEQDETATTAKPTAALVLPTIMEVPQWLARLEPTLAALERDESPTKEISSGVPTTEIAVPRPDDEPPAQQTLF